MTDSKNNQSLLPVYLITGEDALKRDAVMKRLRTRLSSMGDLSFNSELFEGAEFTGDDVVNACNTIPFASPVRLVEVRDADKLKKADSEPIVSYLDAPCETTVLALVAEKLAKNTRLYKAVAKHCKTAVIDCAPPKARDLPKLVRSMAVGHGVTFSEGAAIALVKRTIRDHRRVIFNGNGYTAEWEEEAAKRGLPNKKNTPAALPALIEPKNIALMEDFGVLTKVEMESRYEVEMEHYSKIINIEALTMLEMARKQLLPAVNAYMSEVANTAASKLAVSESISVRSETKTLGRLSADADAMSDAIDTLQDAVDAAKALPSESEKAVAFHDNVLPAMDTLRAAADDAETLCGEDYWPLPSYSKMLYYV